MKKLASVFALALFVGACGSGSNPFSVVTVDPTDPTTPTANGIPADIQGGMLSFSYDPSGETLVVTGISLDEDSSASTYRRRSSLDVLAPNGTVAYQAYTAQDDPLDEHTTAYIKTIGSVTAAVAVTGGQFSYYDGGALYTRSGVYDPVVAGENNDTGLVSYAGSYIGLSNVNGPNTDLLPVDGTIPGDILPTQASVVNGSIFINVSFGDNELKGVVYDRSVILPDAVTGTNFTYNLPNLLLVPTVVADDGTFNGTVEISGPTLVGTYGGILGGPNSEAVAGGIFVAEHFDDAVGGEEEYGVFVLGQCGTAANNDPVLCTTGGVE